MQSFLIPDEAFYYILLQRTAYQMPLNRYFRRVRLGAFYDKYILRWIEISRRKEISQLYTNDMRSEYNTFEEFLPSEAKNILDIGCGIAGIHVFLHRHYRNSEPELYLLDKECLSEKVIYGYHNTSAFYNSLAAAREFLAANGVPSANIHALDIDGDGFPVSHRFDVILSLSSWGFHYPVEAYLDEAYDTLSNRGSLIIDIRSGTGGKRTLAEKFASVETIVESEKYERVLVRK